MRILIDARLYGLENAGLGRYVINLVDELCKIGGQHQYIILLRKKYYNQLKLPENWKKIEADFHHYSLHEQLKLPFILYRSKADLVHFPHFNIPIFYFGKFIVTIHDLLMHNQKGLEATTLPIYKYFVKRLVYKLVFAKAVKKSRKILVPSLAVKNELIKTYKIASTKIYVTYEGVDKKITQYSKRSHNLLKKYNLNEKYLIYAGNAYPHKNLPFVISVIRDFNVSQKIPVAFSICSSRNIFTARLENIIQKLGAQRTTKLLGFVPDGEYGFLLKNSLGFVFPSLSEGFGLPGLETMMAGSILIASDIPVFREVYKDNALYFNPKDERSLETVLMKVLIMKKDERDMRIKKAKEFVKKYSWSKMAKQTLKAYEDSTCL